MLFNRSLIGFPFAILFAVSLALSGGREPLNSPVPTPRHEGHQEEQEDSRREKHKWNPISPPQVLESVTRGVSPVEELSDLESKLDNGKAKQGREDLGPSGESIVQRLWGTVS